MLSEVNVSLYSKNGNSKLNIFLNVLIILIVVALVFEIAFNATFSGIYVVGMSMNDTLTGAEEFHENGTIIATTDGDYVYVNKYAKPDYGDIVVVNKDSKTTIIKRVIALGGDYVKLDCGILYIRYKGSEEFTLVEEDYVSPEHNKENSSFPSDRNGNLNENGYYVREGYFFLLGDNRDNSADSRSSGSFPLSALYGVVADWSMAGKSFFTAVHKYFSFDLPSFFGFDNRIKRSE